MCISRDQTKSCTTPKIIFWFVVSCRVVSWQEGEKKIRVLSKKKVNSYTKQRHFYLDDKFATTQKQTSPFHKRLTLDLMIIRKDPLVVEEDDEDNDRGFTTITNQSRLNPNGHV